MEGFLWCRVEEDDGRLTRVNVMHPNGEILFSYPPEHFEEGLLRRIWAGQVRARVAGTEEAPILEFVDETGLKILRREPVENRSIAQPRDGAER